MNLLLDAGNTRWKWALEQDYTLVDSGVIDSHNVEKLETKLDDLVPQGLSGFRISSVVAEKNTKISEWGQRVLGLQARFAIVKKEHRGLTASYANVANLGVDRWLAMLAAWEKIRSACLIIDAGSALTVDYLDESGMHQGGLIVPGIAMMRRALFEKTSAVKVESIAISHDWQLGCDTIPCVSNGLSAMIKGFIAELVAKADKKVKILITGGDALSVKSFLSQNVEVHDHLVLEGLLYLDS